jgi:hypothetical protein
MSGEGISFSHVRTLQSKESKVKKLGQKNKGIMRTKKTNLK